MGAQIQFVPEATNVPIKGIIPYLQDFDAHSTIPAGWWPCDGSVIVDASSPLNGKTAPAMNGNSETTKLFLRGSTTSGTIGGNDNFDGASSNRYSTGTDGDLIPKGTPLVPKYYEVVFIIRIR